MKIRPTLTILVVLIAGVWLLSHIGKSGAAGLETTVRQELEVVGQIGGEITAVAPATPFANDSWIRTYPLEEQQFLNDFLLTSNGTALLLEGRWLMKVDEQGEVVWRHRYTDIAYGTLAAIAETIDGYVLGVSNYNEWSLIKLDAMGQVLWAKKYGGSNYFGVGSVIQTSDLGYLVAGSRDHGCSVSVCGTDYWIAKLDVNGLVEWSQNFNEYSLQSVQQTADGNLLVVFSHQLLKLGLDGSVIWSKSYNIDSGLPGFDSLNLSDAYVAMDGGLILAGTNVRVAGIPGPIYEMCFLMKLDAAGGVEWARGYESEAIAYVRFRMFVQPLDKGGYVATCSGHLYEFYDDGFESDFGLLQLDEAGFIVWQQESGGESKEMAHAVVETADDAFLVAGRSDSFNDDVDFVLWRVRPEDDLCRCSSFAEGSMTTVDTLVVTSAAGSVTPLNLALNQSNETIVAQPETAVSQVVCSTVVEDEVTAVIPVSGGTVAASDGHISLVFPSGSFSETVQVTYRHFWDDVATGELAGMGERLEVTAVYSATQQPAQLLPGATVTATIHYTDNSPAIEETLAWYQWQETGWHRVDSSQLSLLDKTLTAVVEELGQIAVLGETYRVYMPGIPKNSNRQGYRLLLHLDESGNNFADRSGYGHDGQCDGSRCPTAVAGVNQMARHFDGVNNVIQLGDPQTLNLKGEVTLAAWLKPETAVGLQNIIAHGYALNPKAELFLRLNNGNYEVGSWDGSDHKAIFTLPVGDIGQWVYLVGVYDGESWRLYRNGVQVSSTNDSTGAVAVHGRWAVGANGEGDGRFFQGSIDEVLIYDHGLTAVDVAELYQSYLSP